MNCHRHSNRLFFYSVVLLFLGGCAEQVRRPVRICPGKASVDEAISVLDSRIKGAVPLRARGQCLLRYKDQARKTAAQNFPVQLWLNPPYRIYMQGNVAVDPRAVVVGANEEEFWLIIRPKEISSYYWGKWNEASYVDELVVSPKIVLEAFGILTMGGQGTGGETWRLAKEGAYDVLTSHDEDGRMLRRIYVYNCDYLVRRIEYMDKTEQVAVVAELGGYRRVAEGFLAPTTIMVSKRTGDGRDDSIKITLSSLEPAAFSEKVQNRIFSRPKSQGFKHVYRVADGNMIEE